ncbi:MAG: hypothetical protein RLN81_01600 [Balneolaceae bacterium]
MKNIYKSSLSVLIAGALILSCDGIEDSLVNDRLEENPVATVEANAGSADFSNYVAIGNSLTAGFMDAALYSSGQANSLGALLASQFAYTVDGDYTFVQPDINSVNGYNTSLNTGTGTVFGRFKLDTNIPGPSPTINGEAIGAYTGPSVNNFGVPGIVVGQLLIPATGGPASPANPAYSPFYERFASAPGTSTIIGDVIAADPTFFSLWIGSNDVLGYAVGGAANEAILTSTVDFETQYNAVISSLMNNTTADGVVANIPFFLGLAYFQAVPYNAIPMDAATAGAVNAGYADYNNGLTAAVGGMLITQEEADRRTINFEASAGNAFVMEDESLTDLSGLGLPNLRQSEPTDLVVLGAASVLGQDLGSGAVGVQAAAGDNLVLTPEEQFVIEASRQTFNGIIGSIVAANSDRIAYYDAGATTSVFYDLFGLSDGVPGITVDGVDLTPDFAPTGVLSTDGVHPNARGYGILANEFLSEIEFKFGAIFPGVNVLDLPSVTVCGVGDCASEQ